MKEHRGKRVLPLSTAFLGKPEKVGGNGDQHASAIENALIEQIREEVGSEYSKAFSVKEESLIHEFEEKKEALVEEYARRTETLSETVEALGAELESLRKREGQFDVLVEKYSVTLALDCLDRIFADSTEYSSIVTKKIGEILKESVSFRDVTLLVSPADYSMLRDTLEEDLFKYVTADTSISCGSLIKIGEKTRVKIGVLDQYKLLKESLSRLLCEDDDI